MSVLAFHAVRARLARLRTMDKKADASRAQFRWTKMSRPAAWRAEVNHVRQPCWCQQEWTGTHADGTHGTVWVRVVAASP